VLAAAPGEAPADELANLEVDHSFMFGWGDAGTGRLRSAEHHHQQFEHFFKQFVQQFNRA
jgi:hypothetical protein